MTYILDGIKTAMEVDSRDGYDRVICSCGWVGEVRGSWAVHDIKHHSDRAALRFHYTHCAHARIPNLIRGEPE